MKQRLLGVFLVLSGVCFSQEQLVKTASENACECLNDISYEETKEKKNTEIKSCIESSLLLHQIIDASDNLISEKNLQDTRVTDTIIPAKTQVIVYNEHYDEVQAYMLAHCPQMRKLLSSDETAYTYSNTESAEAGEFYNLGLAAFEKQDYKQAAKMFKKAVKTDPKYAFAWDNLGICYRHLNQYKKAIAAYNTSLELDPNGKVPLMNKGVAYMLMEDYKNAIKSYKVLIAIHPTDPEGYYGISKAMFLNKDYDGAIKNVIEAYIIYQETSSPYLQDAQQLLAYYYNTMVQEGKEDLFNTLAKKYNIITN